MSTDASVGGTTAPAAGTVLTCSHDECPCRVRVEVECHCSGAGAAYLCSCGAPMVPTDDASATA